MARITIKEIAKKAGVSAGTVDRVLHNRGEVAEATRDLVLKIAKEGNYSTNVFARNLKLNKVYNLAVILPKDNEYWKNQSEGIEEAAEEYASLGMQLSFYTFDRQDKDSFLTQSNIALNSSPDGVILAPLLQREATQICESLQQADIPFIFVDSNLDNIKPLAFIGQDSRQSGFLAAKLLNLGYASGQRAIVIKYTDFDSLNKTLDERIEGFRKYYQQENFSPELIHEITLEKDFVGLPPGIESLLGNQEPVHFFVPNSRVHQIAKSAENVIPRHLSRIIGYDLVRENIVYLNKGLIDFVIYQNPKVQGNLAVQAFYKHLILKTEVPPTHYMQLDIITKENLMYGV